MLKGFASYTSSSHCWLACLLGWRVGSLCSTRITGLPRSYGPVRPCASHRYSAPHGSATWSSPLASRRQVPTFRTRASRWPHAVFMPVTTRTVGRHLPSFFPGQQLEPGFGDVPTLSTRHQRFTCVRLASAHLTGSPRLFRNAHHLGHWAKAACGGLDPDPAIRARGTCPHLLCSKAASSWLSLLHGCLLFAPSWRTVVGIPFDEICLAVTIRVPQQRQISGPLFCNDDIVIGKHEQSARMLEPRDKCRGCEALHHPWRLSCVRYDQRSACRDWIAFWGSQIFRLDEKASAQLLIGIAGGISYGLLCRAALLSSGHTNGP